MQRVKRALSARGGRFRNGITKVHEILVNVHPYIPNYKISISRISNLGYNVKDNLLFSIILLLTML